MKILEIKSINGEYATLVDDNGEELFIALALLSLEVDIGTRLVFNDGEFAVLP